jgi:hypothetical protein
MFHQHWLLVFELIAAGCWPLSNKARVLFWVRWSEVVVVRIVVVVVLVSGPLFVALSAL